MSARCLDSFATRSDLRLERRTLAYFSLPALAKKLGIGIDRLPYSLRILLENLLRHEDGRNVTRQEVEALARWDPKQNLTQEIAFYPARVLLQDFTGVPAVVDLAAMRDAMAGMGGDPAQINPLFPLELVIDHSIVTDSSGRVDSLAINTDLEYHRNRERYLLLRWAQRAFDNFRVVPPSTGIVHQVNVEHLARIVFEADGCAYPDTLVGTDSHTTMVNALGVLGWGVGGIEAEAAMLGQPITLLVPPVIGVRLVGRLPPGATATDLVLTITALLRRIRVVGALVEFFGAGLSQLPLADRATISNMCPEYGSTAAMFPLDAETLAYARLTGRSPERIQLIEAYARAQGLLWEPAAPEPRFSQTIELDLSTVVPTLAGPRRPHDQVPLSAAASVWRGVLPELVSVAQGAPVQPDASQLGHKVPLTVQGESAEIGHGSVVLAAITSCTNTSNPSVMVAAGLLAQKAVSRGLRSQPWVKTSLAPGSQVVTDYLRSAGLLSALESLGFHVVGYGCMTCIGNSGPLAEPVAQTVRQHRLVVASVLSGNRNFEGRISPDVRANFLASPPLVVAYALAGRMDIDFDQDPIGHDTEGQPVFLRDLWPSPEEVKSVVARTVTQAHFARAYEGVFVGDDRWQALPVPAGDRYSWNSASTYIRHPTFFEGMSRQPEPLQDIVGARVLLMLGDTVTTDHISPASSIPSLSPAGEYLAGHGVPSDEFSSYGARRGNHEVMLRGTFANVRLRNQLVPGTEGGITCHLPDGERMTVYQAAQRYAQEDVPLLVLAGREYGTGSSRDWAAKGTSMLGIRAVLAESFERIHRSNLIGMGVLPLEFLPGQTRQSLGLTGLEVFGVSGLTGDLAPKKRVEVRAAGPHGDVQQFEVVTRIDTAMELEYFRHGGILRFVVRQLLG
ncbi:aconitate hydratase AcnA [Myxococcota bacterium]